MRRRFVAILVALTFALAVWPALGGQVPVMGGPDPAFELWTVDQSDARNGGDRLYVYTSDNWHEPHTTVELGAAARGIGNGAGVRPHLLLFNQTHTHALLANVATGHVYVIRASDRSIVASIDVGDQAHGAIASPDDRWILVANQNGKRLARIRADFVNERFTYQPEADLDLKAMENPNQPDNAPICPVMYVGGGGKAYVTLRGGGMYVVDTTTTPMRVVRQYTRQQIAPAGCGGLQVGNDVWINSGTPRDGYVYKFNARTDDLILSMRTTNYGSDAHGMVMVGGRYVWMANRGDGDNIVVIDTLTNEIVNVLRDVGAAPDLMDVSPAGNLVFVTLRGPRALTGLPSSVGETPGVAVMEVYNGGLTGRRIAFIPIGSQSPDTYADPHALAVRWTYEVPAR